MNLDNNNKDTEADSPWRRENAEKKSEEDYSWLDQELAKEVEIIHQDDTNEIESKVESTPDSNDSNLEDEYIEQITNSLQHQYYGDQELNEETVYEETSKVETPMQGELIEETSKVEKLNEETSNEEAVKVETSKVGKEYQTMKWISIGACIVMSIFVVVFVLILMKVREKETLLENNNATPSVTEEPVTVPISPIVTITIPFEITMEVSPTPTEILVEEVEVEQQDEVLQFLLLGEENIDGTDERGETDFICIASMNITDQSLKLISFSKDTYVSVPGHGEMILGKVYQKGGASLLYSTLKENFLIDVNGYVLTGFDTFEQVVDALGGVWITLSEQEVECLNTTNYISDSKYRNLESGLVKLNGNQALGYCRIPVINKGENALENYGRVSRQQTLMYACLNEFKSKNYVEMASILNAILPYLRTDLTKNEFQTYVEQLIDFEYKELLMASFPISYIIRTINEEKVIVPDLEANQATLQNIIYQGVDKEKIN